MRQMDVLLSGIQRLGLDVSENQVCQFQRYFQELIDWNSNINLTAITDYRQVQSKHFLDSLTVCQAIPEAIDGSVRLIDVGSGAGFPSLPLKILWPCIQVTLVESVAKKAAFLRHISVTLGLKEVDVICQRAEVLAHDPELRESFDVVVSRAVSELNTLAELTLPFCKVGGRVIAQKKFGIENELKQAEKAITLFGGHVEKVELVEVAELGEQRCLIVLTKDSECPSKYPRRTGIPTKRPI